jgi:hypothetical protein
MKKRGKREGKSLKGEEDQGEGEERGGKLLLL